MALQNVKDIESKTEDKKIRTIVVATLPTQEVREGIINGEPVRFVTIEEYLTAQANQ